MPFALKARRCWIGHEGPIYTEVSFQALEVVQIEAAPIDGCVDLGFPVGAEVGDLGNDGGILDHVGELAALGEGAEAVVVLAGGGEVIGIHGEVSVNWSVIADPCKGFKPGVI